jgi:hypothetical protein
MTDKMYNRIKGGIQDPAYFVIDDVSTICLFQPTLLSKYCALLISYYKQVFGVHPYG